MKPAVTVKLLNRPTSNIYILNCHLELIMTKREDKKEPLTEPVPFSTNDTNVK